MNLFSPNYGAAAEHIAELMREREDYAEASKAQAARIMALEKRVASLEEDLATSQEQCEVQTLISESKHRQLEEQISYTDSLTQKLERARTAMETMWGLMQDVQMRHREQKVQIQAGADLLESVSEMLAPSTESSLSPEPKEPSLPS